MTKHRGYYIDHIYFNSKEEIDNFIKKQAIDRFIQLHQHFVKHPTMEMSIACSEQAERLHDQFGFEWDEIEELEIKAITAA